MFEGRSNTASMPDKKKESIYSDNELKVIAKESLLATLLSEEPRSYSTSFNSEDIKKINQEVEALLKIINENVAKLKNGESVTMLTRDESALVAAKIKSEGGKIETEAK